MTPEQALVSLRERAATAKPPVRFSEAKMAARSAKRASGSSERMVRETRPKVAADQATIDDPASSEDERFAAEMRLDSSRPNLRSAQAEVIEYRRRAQEAWRTYRRELGKREHVGDVGQHRRTLPRRRGAGRPRARQARSGGSSRGSPDDEPGPSTGGGGGSSPAPALVLYNRALTGK